MNSRLGIQRFASIAHQSQSHMTADTAYGICMQSYFGGTRGIAHKKVGSAGMPRGFHVAVPDRE